MSEKPAIIKIDLKHLSYEEGSSLHDFIKKQKGVKEVHVRLAGMNASAETVRARNPVQFTGLRFLLQVPLERN